MEFTKLPVFSFQSEDLFASQETPDIEDVLSTNSQNKRVLGPAVTSSKRKRPTDLPDAHRDLNKSWRDAIGNPPKMGNSKVQWSCVFLICFSVTEAGHRQNKIM